MLYDFLWQVDEQLVIKTSESRERSRQLLKTEFPNAKLVLKGKIYSDKSLKDLLDETRKKVKRDIIRNLEKER